MAYFTVAQFRARYPDLATTANVAKYPDATVEEYRELAEQAIEDAAGVAFEPRTTTRTLYLNDFEDLLLLQPKLRTITAVTINDEVLTDLSALRIDESTVAGRRWRGQITIAYTHGYDEPPLRVKHAAMILTRQWMIHGPIDERRTQLPTEFGGAINLATPGVQGSIFGLPEVDMVVQLYRLPAFF